ncbi:MAG TPA: hypothetical protein PKD51_13280 [Saprospiraceae bacterium]|nr:hypothetical protein [Saprospiraceae bacterium]
MKPSEFHSYIDLSSDYCNVVKLNAYKDYDNDRYFLVSEYGSRVKVEKIYFDEYIGELVPFYMMGDDGWYRNSKYKRVAHQYYDNIKVALTFISAAPDKRIEIDKLKNQLATKSDLTKEEISAHLKIMIAHQDLLPSKSRKKIFLEPSFKNREFYNKNQFLSSIAQELEQKSKRITEIINHPGTIGSYREDLLKNVLSKYLPKKFSISSGFIEGCPRQIDIIIYDSHNYIPLFRENNIVVVKIESVRAIIEVKSKLTKDKLTESLKLLNEVSNIRQSIIPFYKGVFAFSSNLSSKRICTIIREYYDHQEHNIKWNKLNYLFQSIDSLCVFDKTFVFTDQIQRLNREEYRFKPNLKSTVNRYEVKTENSLFFLRLFQYFDTSSSSIKINNEFFSTLNVYNDVQDEGVIHEDEMNPNHSFIGTQIINSKVDLKSRFNNIVKWLNGDLTSDEMHKIYSNREETIHNKP